MNEKKPKPPKIKACLFCLVGPAAAKAKQHMAEVRRKQRFYRAAVAPPSRN